MDTSLQNAEFTLKIPVVDIFAGPGGLSEGFASFSERGTRKFDVKLSIEADYSASETLRLRAFTRAFEDGALPADYGRFARGAMTLEKLYDSHKPEAEKAASEVWTATLGQASQDEVRSKVKAVIPDHDHWVLIGGPPCQAYSLAGRSRMRPVQGDEFDNDHRHFLYKEYLRILSDHKPTVFIFENVKGLLSSTVEGRSVFDDIHHDLQSPSKALGRALTSEDHVTYKLFPVVNSIIDDERDPKRYLVKSEKFGIPQKRHRIIIMGIRSDAVSTERPELIKEQSPIKLEHVISDLPRIRSRISKKPDVYGEWKNNLKNYVRDAKKDHSDEQLGYLKKSLKVISKSKDLGNGSSFTEYTTKTPAYRSDWFLSDVVGGYVGHEARSHMRSDLWRYFFASNFAISNSRSAKLADFPESLLPNHKNAHEARRSGNFADRFRVQLIDTPASTITSHISKDGHYFIHPSPEQCRSLTVREAARIQTFPDDYVFLGTRTQQYVQVGNAVPPLLAQQIADVVNKVVGSLNTSYGTKALTESQQTER